MKIRKGEREREKNSKYCRYSFTLHLRILYLSNYKKKKKQRTVTARRKFALLKNKNRRGGRKTREKRETDRGRKCKGRRKQRRLKRGGNECQRRQGRLKCGRHNLTGDRGNFRPTSPSPEPCLFFGARTRLFSGVAVECRREYFRSGSRSLLRRTDVRRSPFSPIYSHASSRKNVTATVMGTIYMCTSYTCTCIYIYIYG